MRPRRNSQEQPWCEVLFPHQVIHTTISLSYFADTEAPSRWEKLTIHDGMLPTSTEIPDQLDLKVDEADSHLTHHKPIRRMSRSKSYPLGTITIKLLTVFRKLGHMVLRVLACCGPPCLAKIKLSFSTSPKLCLRDFIQH